MEAVKQDLQGTDKLSGLGRKFFDLIEFDDKEVLLLEIRKHPIGAIFLFLIGGFAATLVALLTVSLAVSRVFNSIGVADAAPLVVFLGFVLSIIIIVVTFVSVELYRNNVVYVTNQKIAQVLYISIFNRKVSQLNIGDAQDVTVLQETLMSNILKYGTLVIETAGEQQNYTFTYVPEPHKASKVIVTAREADIKIHGN